MAEKKCPKCGREAAEGQAFCSECLAEMEKYPVKPGVVVLLPPQEQSAAKSSVHRRYPQISPEEQLQKLKKRVAALALALILALGAAGTLGWLVVQDYLEERDMTLLPGQNYSSENSDAEEETK